MIKWLNLLGRLLLGSLLIVLGYKYSYLLGYDLGVAMQHAIIIKDFLQVLFLIAYMVFVIGLGYGVFILGEKFGKFISAE